jgi:hypothetical protein
MGKAGLHVRVGDLFQVPPRRANRTERRQTLLRIVVVHLQMSLDQRFEQFTIRRLESPLLDEDLPQRLGLVEDPGVHGGDKASREMKSICKARMPKSRLRSACG